MLIIADVNFDHLVKIVSVFCFSTAKLFFFVVDKYLGRDVETV